MRPTQTHLIDDTPLGLFGGQGQDRPLMSKEVRLDSQEGQGLIASLWAITTAMEAHPAPVPTVALHGPLEPRPLPQTQREEIAADVEAGIATCRQRMMLDGLDCCPGQKNLFPTCPEF